MIRNLNKPPFNRPPFGSAFGKAFGKAFGPEGGAVPFDPFSPLDTPDCKFWVDPRRGITNIGGFASQWDDQSGEGNHLLQATPADRPLIVTSGALPLLRCDGISKNMATLPFGSPLSQPNTIMWVAKFNVIAAGGTLIDGLTTNMRHALLEFASDWALFAGNIALFLAENTNKNIFNPIFDGTSTRLYINGGTSGTANGGSNAMDGITMSARFSGGSVNCDVFEAALWNRRLSIAELNTNGEGFANRHGLTWTTIVS